MNQNFSKNLYLRVVESLLGTNWPIGTRDDFWIFSFKIFVCLTYSDYIFKNLELKFFFLKHYPIKQPRHILCRALLFNLKIKDASKSINTS